LKTEEVTQQILGAWDEMQEADEAEPEGAVAPPVEDEPEKPEGEEVETPEADEPEQPESDESAEDEPAEESEEGEPEEEAAEQDAPEFEDVEVQAFLSKYNGDVEKALKGGAELQRLIERQGREKNDAIARAEQLEAQLIQAQAFGGLGTVLSDDQQEWVATAAESANPAAYVQQAMQAGEFELARAVCREWATVNPFEAMRVGQWVDATEAQASQPAAPEPVDPGETWKGLATAYPELRSYEAQMVQTLERLGPDHPLVQEARSTDQAQAVRGIIGIYEIAKAATFALSETRDGIKAKQRQAAEDAIGAAVVTSGVNTPSAGGTPRPRMLMPGLSQEDFDAAFAASQ
jgi:hypothetical protein